MDKFPRHQELQLLLQIVEKNREVNSQKTPSNQDNLGTPQRRKVSLI